MRTMPESVHKLSLTRVNIRQKQYILQINFNKSLKFEFLTK